MTVKNNDKNNENPASVAIRKKQNANLKPIKPGEVRNPNGRPKGRLDYNTRVDMAMEAIAMKMVEEHNAKKENKNKQISIKDIDIEGNLFMKAVELALGGSEKMIIDFQDRRHGKARQPVEITGEGGGPVEIEFIKAKEEVAGWMKMWAKTSAN